MERAENPRNRELGVLNEHRINIGFFTFRFHVCESSLMVELRYFKYLYRDETEIEGLTYR